MAFTDDVFEEESLLEKFPRACCYKNCNYSVIVVKDLKFHLFVTPPKSGAWVGTFNKLLCMNTADFLQVALWHGLVMGGGAGLSVPGTFGVATEKTVSCNLFFCTRT